MPKPAGRDAIDRPLPQRRIGEPALGEAGQHRSRRDRVDADAVRCEIERHAHRQRPQAALGGEIGCLVTHRRVRELGGDEDDSAALLAFDHAASNRLPDHEGRRQVDA